MRHIFLTLFFLGVVISGYATHLTGGELSYRYMGNNLYEITVKVYRDCGPDNVNGTGFDAIASVGIYQTGTLIENLQIVLDNNNVNVLPNDVGNPCLIIPDDVCIEEAIYIGTTTLTQSAIGYDLVYQRCCRSPSITNLLMPEDLGSTYHAFVPGTGIPGVNSSPFFENLPPPLFCLNEPFEFDHSAYDEDGDELSYSLCNPFHGADFFNPQPSPPAPPPFVNVTWATGYSWDDPIPANPNISINPVSGILSGTPTALGKYTVGVCVKEFRNGQLVSTVIRDFMYRVTPCAIAIAAAIEPQAEPCTGLTLNFINNSSNANTYTWDFGVDGIENDTSIVFEPTYTYADTGTYLITLIAEPGFGCADTVWQEFSVFEAISATFVLPEPFCAGAGMAIDPVGDGIYGPNDSFLWTYDGPATPSVSSLLDPGVTVFSTPGTYDITFTIFNDNCVTSMTQAIEIPIFPIAEVDPQNEYCTGLTINFSNASQYSSAYWWDFGLPSNSDVSTDENPSFTYPDYGTYNVLLVADPASDCSDTTNVQVIVSPEDPILMGYNINSGAPCDTIPGIDASFTGNNADVITWDMGDGTELEGSLISYVYDESGTYTVTLTVYNDLCDFEKSEEIVVVYETDAIDAKVIMPNVISPTADNWNERFMPFFRSSDPDILPDGRTVFDYLGDYSLKVYDRWGVEFFDSASGINFWDGYLNGEIVTEGTYYFLVEYLEQCATDKTSYSGTVTVLHQ
jgi:PKD repeat protein